MMKNRLASRTGILLASLLLIAVHGLAQEPSVVATGLRTPSKLTFSDDGRLLVSESGAGPNTGAVSRVDRCGQTLRLLDGLPAGFEPRGASSGPTGIEVLGRMLWVAIGGGDGTLPGTIPGTELPNSNPSSPLLSSVLSIEFGTDIDELQSGFLLKRMDQDELKAGFPVVLFNAQGASATLKLLVDFPNHTDDPILIARASNPFALARLGGQLFLADASQNAIIRIDLPSGIATRIATIPPLVNPLPFGPPRIDAVPDGIRIFNGRLLITLLTGFPFPAGSAQVLSLDPLTGSLETGIAGLSNAIDVFPVRLRNGFDEFFTLEYTTNMLAPLVPGRLQLFRGASAAPELIAGGLITPTGLARDPVSGDLFITEYFPGRILQVFGAGDEGFDVSLEDDHTRDVLRFNSHTGEYLFLSCRLGKQFSGIARLSRGPCRTGLRSARVTAVLEGCSGFSRMKGEAQISLTGAGPDVFIVDSNMANNTNVGRW